jgi:transcriptional regulator with XRE-family HTH domain
MPKKIDRQLLPVQTNNESIGERLAKIRKSQGLTQKQVAVKIGITQTLISDYEVGRAHLTDKMLIRLAIVLNVSSDEILGLKKQTSPKSMPRLKLLTRMLEIEQLSPAQQKALLKNIDMFLKAARQEKKAS